MAKRPSKQVQPSKQVKVFLQRLATEPDLLFEFIQDPEKTLNTVGIQDKETRIYIRNSLALEVAKQLLVVPPAYYVYFGE